VSLNRPRLAACTRVLPRRNYPINRRRRNCDGVNACNCGTIVTSQLPCRHACQIQRNYLERRPRFTSENRFSDGEFYAQLPIDRVNVCVKSGNIWCSKLENCSLVFVTLARLSRGSSRVIT